MDRLDTFGHDGDSRFYAQDEAGRSIEITKGKCTLDHFQAIACDIAALPATIIDIYVEGDFFGVKARARDGWKKFPLMHGAEGLSEFWLTCARTCLHRGGVTPADFSGLRPDEIRSKHGQLLLKLSTLKQQEREIQAWLHELRLTCYHQNTRDASNAAESHRVCEDCGAIL